MPWEEYLTDAEYAKECQDKEDGPEKEGDIGVREPRKPIKPSDKDSIALIP